MECFVLSESVEGEGSGVCELGDAEDGLLQIWINDVSVYDEKKIRTVYSHAPWGGNAKWGIYKWPWMVQAKVDLSAAQGITHVETFMGPLRMITRHLGDPDYGVDSYSEVRPR